MADSASLISEEDKWRYISPPKMGPSKILHARLSIDPGYVQSGFTMTALCHRISDKKLFFCSTVFENHDYKSLYGNRQGLSCDVLMSNIIDHYDKKLLPQLSRLYPIKQIKVVIESQFDVSGNYQNNYANPSNVVAAALYGFFIGKGMKVEVVKPDRKFGMNEGLGEWKPSRDTRKIVAVDTNRVLFEEWGVFDEKHKLLLPHVDAVDEAYKEVHDAHDAALQGADSILTDNPNISAALHFRDVIEKIKVAVEARRQKVSLSEAAKIRKRKARDSTQPKNTPKTKRRKVKE